MPSTRKRIGYLPSTNAQEIIRKIANEERLSQSKVVGVLVEEALIARGEMYPKGTNDLTRKNQYRKNNNLNSSSLKYNDLDEFISDEGITYSKNKNKDNSGIRPTDSKEALNKELFEQFNQFILFQKMKLDE